MEEDMLNFREPKEQLWALFERKSKITIGLPRCLSSNARLFPLTPESVGMLVEHGFRVLIEEKAAMPLRYPDTRYSHHGAEIVSRSEAFKADIVIHLAPVTSIEVGLMRRNSTLMTLRTPSGDDPAALAMLTKLNITALALNRVIDAHQQRPFHNILSEVDGYAAIVLGAALLSDPAAGKGILLGGALGVVPCEVLIIGGGIAGRTAARAALGQGAIVRLFDTDTYRLRMTQIELDKRVICSDLNPHVLTNAMRSADLVIATDTQTPITIDSSLVEVAKRGALFFDLNSARGDSFNSLPAIDACDGDAIRSAMLKEQRFCLTSPGSRVARTAAMTLSNALFALLDSIKRAGDISSLLHIHRGIRQGVYTYRGKVVDAELAHATGAQRIDLEILLSMS
ncbi:MAG: hypothetical protein HUK14_00180 [Muribaculaceae bacterium]|nr:hypothetical protein [Muribaculaceae bacterium]